MSGIVRSAFRLAGAAKLVANNSTKNLINLQCSRSMWHMGNRYNDGNTKTSVKLLKSYNLCNCGCGRYQHTQAEKELTEFLQTEIAAEKDAHKNKPIPSKLGPFSVSLDGSTITLKKQDGDESISIVFNVNHTVGSDVEPDESAVEENNEFGELISKPNFTIDIKRGTQTLGFTCSFNEQPGASGDDDNYNDIFGIDEITIYQGEHSDTVYAASGEVLDGMLYDHLMNYLEEKGISNDFAEEIIQLSTNYERNAYISLLEGLAKFTSGK